MRISRTVVVPAAAAVLAGCATSEKPDDDTSGVDADGVADDGSLTVGPLAERLGITVDHRFGKGDEEELVEHMVAGPWPTLISETATGRHFTQQPELVLPWDRPDVIED